MKTQPTQRKRLTTKSKFDEALLKLGKHIQSVADVQLVCESKNNSKLGQ